MTFEEYLSSLKGKTVGVIGVGVSNRPLIEKLLERGIDVTARDKKEDLGELGQADGSGLQAASWERISGGPP